MLTNSISWPYLTIFLCALCLQPIGPHVLPVKVWLRKLTVYPHSYIRRPTEVTQSGESSKVNVLAGEGLAIPPGRSMKRTLQPRYASHARTGVHGVADADLLQRWGRLVRPMKEQSHAIVRSAGVRKAARREETCGANWGASRYQPIQGRRAKTHRIIHKPVGGVESFG